MILVRNASDRDFEWGVGYILGGFDYAGYRPDSWRVKDAITACVQAGVALVAEKDGRHVGILGAYITPIFWAERNVASICALRSTYPGAGLVLLNHFRRIVQDRPDIKQVVFNFAPENTDPRIDRLMARWGAQPMRSFLIQQ